MPNAQALVVRFLIVALLVGGAAGAFLYAPHTPALKPEASRTAANANAFANLPEPASTNLTDQLAKRVADGIIAANPEGPTVEDNEAGINSPGAARILEEYLSSEKILSIANAWTPEKPAIRITDAADKESLTRYLSSLHELVTGSFSGQIAELLASNPDPASVNALEASLEKTEKSALGIAAPKPFAALHESLIVVIRESRNLVGTSLSTDDPLREYVVNEKRLRVIQEKFALFQKELSSVKVAETAQPHLSIIDKALGIRAAHAQVPIIVTFDPYQLANTKVAAAGFVQQMLEWGKKLLTEIIKDRLVHKLVQQVITWVQGGGKPQFITNWKTFLKDAAEGAAGSVLAKTAPQLCSSFGPLIKISLLPVNTAPEKSGNVSCTLDQVVQNVQNFYTDFSNGGWIAYGAMLEPQNNYFGAFIETSDILTKEAWKAKEAATQEAAVGGGFLSTKTCVKKEQTSDFMECVNACVASKGGEACLRGCQGKSTAARTVCRADAITTPGMIVADVVGKALPAPIHRIVNAQDVTALVSSLANAALTKLISAGQKGLSGINNSIEGGGLPGFGDACRGLTDPGERANCEKYACEGLEGEELAACKAALGGGGGQSPTSTEPIIPPGEEYNVVEATEGWSGSLVSNPENGTWLVASQHASLRTLYGRILKSSGEPVGPMFVIAQGQGSCADCQVGMGQAAYASEEKKYLVTYVDFVSNETRGQFISPTGGLLGPSFVILPELFLEARLVYTPKFNRFLFVWQSGYDIFAQNISVNGALGQKFIIANVAMYERNPAVAVNDLKNEFCIAYATERNAVTNASSIAVKRLGFDGALGPEKIITNNVWGRTQLAYNSREGEYFATWAAYNVQVSEGKFFTNCGDPEPGPVVTLDAGFPDQVMAYNPVSNTYGMIAVYQNDVRNRFMMLNSSGEEILTVDVFLDAKKGNYVPTIGADLSNGTFGVASSKDYDKYRVITGLGRSIVGRR